MKKVISEFFRRGLIACGFGPLVLVALYLILQRQTGLQTLSVQEVCLSIVSLSALAFIAGGLNVLYRIEGLPLMAAIFIHGSVLYGSYLITYLLNSWLKQGFMPIIVFSIIFVLGFLAIWAIIYFVTKQNAKKLNAGLKQKQHSKEQP